MASDKPTEHEEERIFRLDLERRREETREEVSRLDPTERARLREQHWMRCAKCGSELQEVQFKGVRVDKCFSCGGVYLDDGELEQLAGRAGWFEKIVTLMRK
jgi:hypothetical protein